MDSFKLRAIVLLTIVLTGKEGGVKHHCLPRCKEFLGLKIQMHELASSGFYRPSSVDYHSGGSRVGRLNQPVLAANNHSVLG